MIQETLTLMCERNTGKPNLGMDRRGGGDRGQGGRGGQGGVGRGAGREGGRGRERKRGERPKDGASTDTYICWRSAGQHKLSASSTCQLDAVRWRQVFMSSGPARVGPVSATGKKKSVRSLKLMQSFPAVHQGTPTMTPPPTAHRPHRKWHISILHSVSIVLCRTLCRILLCYAGLTVVCPLCLCRIVMCISSKDNAESPA